nr:RNA-directed DNA polymerase, eukaryota, reverse transcriptase zinc-binding domain protein [Tanacetum cinerariifolium]
MRDEKSAVQNSGVTVIASKGIAKRWYYGVLQEIWKMDYYTLKIPLFTCKWVNNSSGVKVDEYGFTLVNLGTDGYTSEPILAKQATQIFFLQDSSNPRWHIVMHGKRDILGVDNVVDEEEYNQFDELPQFSSRIPPIDGDTTYLPSDYDEGLWVDYIECQTKEKDITDKEIQEAMFDIDNDKAPGPDGYTACFFKKAWNVVGMDVCLVMKEFFQTGKLLKEMNATIMSLIPKLDTPNKVSDFRPIACCNVLYKCISKVLTNRIKSGLKKVVSINQSAFIPGRNIQDNILLTQELLKGYNRKNGPKRCALKIDLQKAYDTVSWSFLKTILERFGFHDVMINWIMTCISTSAFSISVNGQSHGYFKGARGLRQGDPISSYLFTLVMEVLNLIMIKNIKDDGRFKYHAWCKDLQMTHLCFADDLMVFCNGDVHSITVVKKSLNEFSRVSGLFPNLKKSTIFFGSVNGQVKQ